MAIQTMVSWFLQPVSPVLAARNPDDMAGLFSKSLFFCHTRSCMQCGAQGKFRTGVGISPKVLHVHSYGHG